MNKTTNCPNCGAPIVADRCAYCGTVLLDFAAIELGAPCFVKIKAGDNYIMTRLVVDALSVEAETETVEAIDACGCVPHRIVYPVGYALHMDARTVALPADASPQLVVIQTREEAESH